MPQEGVEWKPRESILTLEEIARLVRITATLGVNKVRLTGGEPTVRKGIDTLIEAVAQTNGVESVHMTTNGSTLKQSAQMYRDQGLNAINVSLDTLRPDRFKLMTGQDAFERVWSGIERAVHVGFDSLKINVVVMAGFNDDELLDFVALTRALPLEVRFIEFMPFDKNDWSKRRLVPYRTMRQVIEREFALVKCDTPPNAVDKEFQVPGYVGKVGFVTSMTEDFCGGCDRIRITADGGIKTCLFFPPQSYLLDSMRQGASDEAIAEMIVGAISKKRSGHPSLDVLPQVKNAPMVSIGG